MGNYKYKGYKIIIQARLNSSRYKNKILKKIDSKSSVLEFLILRLLHRFNNNDIIFALAKNKNNFKIINILNKYNISYFEGSENNVLKRYYECAEKFKVSNIIRVTSDCPLVDPFLIIKMLRKFKSKKLEYLSNTLPEDIKKYPDGSDIEIFKFNSLKKVLNLKLSKHDNEHVTNKFWSSNKFTSKIISSRVDYSNYRYSIDYRSDLDLLKYVVSKLKKYKLFGSVSEIVNIIDGNSQMKKIMFKNIVRQKKRRKGIFS